MSFGGGGWRLFRIISIDTMCRTITTGGEASLCGGGEWEAGHANDSYTETSWLQCEYVTPVWWTEVLVVALSLPPSLSLWVATICGLTRAGQLGSRGGAWGESFNAFMWKRGISISKTAKHVIPSSHPSAAARHRERRRPHMYVHVSRGRWMHN